MYWFNWIVFKSINTFSNHKFLVFLSKISNKIKVIQRNKWNSHYSFTYSSLIYLDLIVKQLGMIAKYRQVDGKSDYKVGVGCIKLSQCWLLVLVKIMSWFLLLCVLQWCSLRNKANVIKTWPESSTVNQRLDAAKLSDNGALTS